ncbi:poly(ADP-ribose) polymerase family member 14-related sequence 1 isoform X3 [Centropristis striata]|uniref:poly(ADP-ribose) polymerase family member 14-related sequence 1 isoform X3 n=1 Tax=Centropristis striata TaxID=184440 RepID=UPI0027DF3A31|nr:poly(ADP-ribose) polymerase family member 14-related sequence 1 isoform X3 [Centropristis striata]
MADAYSFALLVEFEENDLPRLKNKLIKHFQSKKAHGGDCEVEYAKGSKTAVVRFRREEDQQNVLKKEAHEIRLDKGVLKVTVRLPADETTTTTTTIPPPPQETPAEKVRKNYVAVINKQSSTDDQKDKEEETADEEPCSTLAVIGNIPETMNQEFLEMLVENVLMDADAPCDSQNFTLEVLRDISSAVVTFQSEKENTDFVTRCPKNRTFSKKGLTARPLEVTNRVIVDDIQNFGEDLLRLYFETAGGDVENLELNEEEQSVIITFKDHKAVQKIGKKKKHHINQEEIRVYPFYKSLGRVLYGKDKPPLKLPAAVSEPIDSALWRYLKDNQSAAKTIHSQLAKDFCKVNLDQSTVRLSPMASLLQQKDAEDITKEWRDTVKSAFAQALLTFRSLKLQPESDVWEECQEKISETLVNEDVVVVPDEGNCVLSVVGLVADVNRLEQTLREVVNKIVSRVQREKSSVTQEMKVSASIYHILCQDGLQDKLQNVYPELKLSFRKDSRDGLMLTGLREEILAANKVIYDAMFALKRQNLEIDNYVLDLLKDEQPEELTNALLTSSGINAAFEINAHRVQLLAASDEDLNVAEDHLGKLLISQYIDVEDSKVLEKSEWRDLVNQLENADSRSYRRIRINTTEQQVVVSGHKDSVIKVCRELEDSLTQNAQVEETVVVKPNAIVEYIKTLDTRWLEQMEDKVEVSYRKEAIFLSGSRVDVAEGKGVVEDLVSSVHFENVKVSMPGAKKFFQDKEAMYVSSLWNETRCLVQLVDDTSGGQVDSAQRPVLKPVYQLQTSDGVEIAVCKADMCSYPVHAIVNASNPDLKHNGGLSAALLNAAGPQLQDECDRIINSKGQLQPGECVITGAGGNLCCKKVIHAVGPTFEAAKPHKALAKLKRAVKRSLELAEENNCISVALPAISRNLGFPLPLCAITIVKAIKEHCDEKYDDNTLKRIHLVNNDDITVQAMEAAVRQEFGNQGVSLSQETKTAKALPVKHTGDAGSNQNCLGQVQTTEGLDVTLTKGNIENANTEVTVNTVFEDLVLNKGAVSTAIFSAAGAKLQQLVNANNASGNFGDIIVTEGCKLKSKQVFHAVSPHWDNGQGTAEKILDGIFKDCLNKAEDSGLTSISFPAIGTGNLAFPKDLVASLMFDEIIAFSKKQPKHLKKVVIILYPKDAQTIQVFSDEFAKKFPNAAFVPEPTSPQQSPGPFSKIVSGSGVHETKMGNVAVQVVTGDITKETSDVIVNSSNENFSLKSGVSKAILDAAGQAVEAECQKLGALPNPGMITTQPGNLKCKKILHLAGQTDPVKIQRVVKEALQMCVTNSDTSVSFPAIGTGQGNVQARQVADAMLDAVVDVLSQSPSTTLKTIRIVIFQPPMLKEFYNSMHQREATEAKEKGGFWRNIGSTLKSLFVGGSSDKPQKEGDFVIEAQKVSPASFHICGGSQARVASAKQWINDLISKEQHSICIKDDSILRFSDADHQRILDIQKTMSVTIRIESKNGQATVTIEGISKDVLGASHDVHEMVKLARDNEELQKNVELAGTVVAWQYQQQGLQFQNFDSMSNFKLEQALEKKLTKVKVTVQGQDYTVTMPKGPATDSQGRTLQIKRIDKLKDEDIPEHWEAMPANTTSHAVTLKAGTPEYKEILTLFQATCPQTPIKIERIQNPVLWKTLQIKRRGMEQRNNHQNNERRLFHGTAHDTVAHINEHGFNRSFAGKNATCYGKGTYFAVNANYSAQNTYSRPNPNGEKCMYVCRVLTGDFTAGQSGMITPPAKGTASVDKYDSVVDNMTTPGMFIVFHDSQAYPEYLITFK